MTYLDVIGQRSRSHLGSSTGLRKHPSWRWGIKDNLKVLLAFVSQQNFGDKWTSLLQAFTQPTMPKHWPKPEAWFFLHPPECCKFHRAGQHSYNWQL